MISTFYRRRALDFLFAIKALMHHLGYLAYPYTSRISKLTLDENLSCYNLVGVSYKSFSHIIVWRERSLLYPARDFAHEFEVGFIDFGCES